jgi:hypothetical protein
MRLRHRAVATIAVFLAATITGQLGGIAAADGAVPLGGANQSE